MKMPFSSHLILLALSLYGAHLVAWAATPPQESDAPLDSYFVHVESENGCCQATIPMHVNDASPSTVKFSVDDAIWEVHVAQKDGAYNATVKQINTQTQLATTAEVKQARMGYNTAFHFEGYQVVVTSGLPMHSED